MNVSQLLKCPTPNPKGIECILFASRQLGFFAVDADCSAIPKPENSVWIDDPSFLYRFASVSLPRFGETPLYYKYAATFDGEVVERMASVPSPVAVANIRNCVIRIGDVTYIIPDTA